MSAKVSWHKFVQPIQGLHFLFVKPEAFLLVFFSYLVRTVRMEFSGGDGRVKFSAVAEEQEAALCWPPPPSQLSSLPHKQRKSLTELSSLRNCTSTSPASPRKRKAPATCAGSVGGGGTGPASSEKPIELYFLQSPSSSSVAAQKSSNSNKGTPKKEEEGIRESEREGSGWLRVERRGKEERHTADAAHSSSRSSSSNSNKPHKESNMVRLLRILPLG